MKDWPILFSGPMVRAILEGRKTQTRRVIKTSAASKKGMPQFTFGPSLREEALRKCKPRCRNGYEFISAPPHIEINLRFPYGLIGSRLWIRETWQPHRAFACETKENAPIIYAADKDTCGQFPIPFDGEMLWVNARGPWKPSIFMPRRLSRITLEITDVRIQRVQEISEEDVKSEGVEYTKDGPLHFHVQEKDTIYNFATAREAYQCLWNSLNEKRGFSWKVNPWVWAITFRSVQP